MQRAPDRRPGTAGDRAAAADGAPSASRVVASPSSGSASRTPIARWSTWSGGGPERRGARSWWWPRATPSAVPDATGSASDTAALLELARVFEGRALAQDARAGVGRRLDARGGRHAAVGRLAGPARTGRRGARDLGPRRARGQRAVVAGVVERLAASGHRAAADGRGVDPPGAGSGGRRHGHARPARAAVVPDRDRRAGRAARGGLRGRAHLRQRRAAAGRAGQPDAIDEERLGGLGRATLRTFTALDQARTRRARPRQLRHGGQPGAARAGCCSCSPVRCCCRRWWRRSTPSPAPGAGSLP